MFTYLCPHCLKPVSRNKDKISEGYFAVCLECDKDMYSIELHKAYFSLFDCDIFDLVQSAKNKDTLRKALAYIGQILYDGNDRPLRLSINANTALLYEEANELNFIVLATPEPITKENQDYYLKNYDDYIFHI